AMGRQAGRRQVKQGAVWLSGVFACALAGCVEPQTAGPLSASRANELVQEGTAVVSDGEETQVNLKQPFDAAPRIEVTGFVQSWFKTEPYSKNSFEIVQPATNNFKIRSNHREQMLGSFAEIKWKATGTKARKKALAEMTPQGRVMDR